MFDDVENNRLAGWIDGQRCVLMIIRRQPGANILATIEGIKAALPLLRTSISPVGILGLTSFKGSRSSGGRCAISSTR